MPAMQEGEEGDVLARKGLADAGRTRRPDRWLRRPGGQGLKVRDGRVEEGKGMTDVFRGLDESEKGDSRERADREEGPEEEGRVGWRRELEKHSRAVGTWEKRGEEKREGRRGRKRTARIKERRERVFRIGAKAVVVVVVEERER